MIAWIRFGSVDSVWQRSAIGDSQRIQSVVIDQRRCFVMNANLDIVSIMGGLNAHSCARPNAIFPTPAPHGAPVDQIQLYGVTQPRAAETGIVPRGVTLISGSMMSSFQ